MAATKSKTNELETKSEVEVDATSMEDRLGDLPEALQLRILTFLDAKHAVQTTLLSKTWVNLWTRIPVLNFNYLSFCDVHVFNRFVDRVLRGHDPWTKPERLKFNGNLSCSTEDLNNIFDYAFLRGVKQLEVSIERVYDASLEELKTMGDGRIRCPGLGSFKNLVVLYLNRAFIIITDVEPFSGFPMLESLTLLECEFWPENKTVISVLQVQSLRLSDLTMLDCKGVECWELRTPRLRFLEYGGFDKEIPKHEDFPVLETLKIDFHGFNFNYYKPKEEEKRLNDDLISLLSTIPNVKSLTLFSTAVLLLSLFPDELVSRGSPFRELKDLVLDLSEPYSVPHLCHKVPAPFEYVKDYLLHNSPDVKFTIIPPTHIRHWEDGPWGIFGIK